MRAFYINTLIFILLSVPSSCYAQLFLNLESTIAEQDSIVKKIKLSKNFPDFTTLQNSAYQIQDSLQNYGYLNAKIIEIEKKSDTLYNGRLFLGSLTTNVYLEYEEEFISSYARKLGLEVKNEYIILKPQEIDQKLVGFAALETQNGHPLSSFQIKNLRQEAETLYGTLIVDRQKLRTINNIKISGYEKFPTSFIRHYANLKTGQIFNEQTLNEKYDQLQNLDFIQSSKDPEVLFTEDSTSVYFYFNKKQANRFDGLLGFGNNQDQDKLRLDGYLDLLLVNNLNYGEFLALNYKSDGNNQQTLNVALELPFLFSTPLGTEASLNLFRRDSTFSTSRQQLNLTYQINARSRLKAGVNLENSSSLNDSLIPTSPEDIQDYDKTLFGLGYNRQERTQNLFFPVKSLVDIQVYTGTREAQNRSESQFAVEETASYTFSLNEGQYFYIENQTRYLESNTFLSNELFRFGGINSIRGFQENAIYANLYTLFRTEYRYTPTANLYFHTISDAAYFENELLNEQGILYSFGFGAGITTAAGILNINLSNGLRESQNFKFSNTILHLQLTTTF